jgi:hypothetical protein
MRKRLLVVAVMSAEPETNSRKAFELFGGWPLTLRGDFDQQLLARLTTVETLGDPCFVAGLGYLFHWGSTGACHGQARMSGPDDETWYTQLSSK